MLERNDLALSFIDNHPWSMPSAVAYDSDLREFSTQFAKDVKEEPVDFASLSGMGSLLANIPRGNDLKGMLCHCSLTFTYIFGGDTNQRRQAIAKHATLLGWAELLRNSSFQEHVLSIPWVINLFYTLNATMGKYVKHYKSWFESMMTVLAPNSQPVDPNSEPSLLVPSDDQLRLVVLHKKQRTRLGEIAKAIERIGDIVEEVTGIPFTMATKSKDSDEIGLPPPVLKAVEALESVRTFSPAVYCTHL